MVCCHVKSAFFFKNYVLRGCKRESKIRRDQSEVIVTVVKTYPQVTNKLDLNTSIVINCTIKLLQYIFSCCSIKSNTPFDNQLKYPYQFTGIFYSYLIVNKIKTMEK